RIWMVMSRDGLLPKRFSYIHPRFRTPSFATVVNGFFVAIPALFLNLTEVTDLTSIGTLFAFVLVSGGVLLLDDKRSKRKLDGKFKIWYINARYTVPFLWLAFFVFLFIYKISWATLLNYLTIPHVIFIIVAIIVSVFAFIREWSSIPLMGLLTNLYLMAELGVTNWLRFLVWLLIGLVIYFSYSIKKSKLNKTDTTIQ
ncbi:MAG: amino acid transporter, partial [Bacteroidales bacterium]|nr:amino acid transporter [Bacteroidales bacterium]